MGILYDPLRFASNHHPSPYRAQVRTGYDNDKPTAHKLIPNLPAWGAAAVTLHGRSRQQRYTKLADWDYITQCAKVRGHIYMYIRICL